MTDPCSTARCPQPDPSGETPRVRQGPEGALAHRAVRRGDRWLPAIPAIVCVLWGGNVVAIRVAVNELPPFFTAASRFSLATAALVAWTLGSGRTLAVTRYTLLPLTIVALIVTAVFGLLHVALKFTPASQVAVLLYLYPFFTASMAHGASVGDHITWRRAAGLVIGFSGAILALGDQAWRAGTASLFGSALAVGSAVLWAWQTVYTKRLVSEIDTRVIVLYTTLIPAVLLGGLSWYTESLPTDAISRGTLVALAYQGLIAGAACSIAWLATLRTLDASVLASYTFLAPVTGVLASALILGEPLPARLYLAVAFVALGLVAIDGRIGGAVRTTCRETRPTPSEGI